jgi:AraC-like DNA-binding protein
MLWYVSDMALSPAERRRRSAFQAAFLRRLGGPQPLRAMFDHLPGVSVSVKDRHSRVVFAARSILEKFGMTEELEIVGTTDRDRYPAHLAEIFLSGDREVLALGRPVIDRAEVWYNAQGALDWCVVTKLPLKDRRGKVIGLMAAMRPWPGNPRRLSASRTLDGLIERIRKTPGAPVSVQALARGAHISARQLQRRFLDLFGVGVKEFMMRARIHAAAEELLGGDKPIAQIALDAGFYDQSTFTRHFRRRAGMTPAQYRRRHVPGGNDRSPRAKRDHP